MLNDIITQFKPQFTTQTELRAQENILYRAVVKDGKLTQNSYSSRSGVFARVFQGGLFGASSSATYDEASVKRVLENAKRIAREADLRTNIGETDIPHTENGKIELYRSLREIDPKEHIDLAFDLDAYIAAHYPKLSHRSVRVRTQVTEKLLAVTNGYDAHTAIIRSYVDIDMVMNDKYGLPVEIGDYFGHNKYLDEVFTDKTWLYREIDNLYKQLCDLVVAVPPQAGTHDIILSPNLSGMLAHEAVGHTCEADGILGGSISGIMLGKQVTSPMVTLMDYANEIPDCDKNDGSKKEAYCKMIVDDEGTLCKDVSLITDGILTDYMLSRQTARNMGMRAKGNCRASQYYDEPMIRMRNTAIAPGNDTIEDMIASIDHGYYLIHNENGSGAANGEFIVSTGLGYEIKNGKILRPIKGTTISGVAFDMLKTVTMIGNKQEFRFGGMCGKKQTIETATGGPAIKVRANMAGV